MRAPSIHELTVARLADLHPAASRKRFAEAIRGLAEGQGASAPPVSVIPDLFWIEAGDGRACDAGSITCIEVEDSNPISAGKLRAYCELWFDLDCFNCELRLLVADRWGNSSPVNLQEYFYHLAKAA